MDTLIIMNILAFVSLFFIKLLLSSPFMIVEIEGKPHRYYRSVKLGLWVVVITEFVIAILS